MQNPISAQGNKQSTIDSVLHTLNEIKKKYMNDETFHTTEDAADMRNNCIEDCINLDNQDFRRVLHIISQDKKAYGLTATSLEKDCKELRRLKRRKFELDMKKASAETYSNKEEAEKKEWDLDPAKERKKDLDKLSTTYIKENSFSGNPRIIKKIPIDLAKESVNRLGFQDANERMIFKRRTKLGVLRVQPKKVVVRNNGDSYQFTENFITFEPFDSEGARHRFSYVANYYEHQIIQVSLGQGIQKETRIIEEETLPPATLGKAILNLSDEDLKPVPKLNRILSRPYIDPEGLQTISKGGYHEKQEIYIDPLSEVEIDNSISVKESIDFINEWLIDFEFKADSDRANTFALGLTLLANDLFTYSNTKSGFFICSSNQGSGKSTLATIMGLGILGKLVGAKPLARSDEEVLKNIIAELDRQNEYIIFDNLSPQRLLNSDVLLSYLSEAKISGRRLGATELIEEDTVAVNVFTGNRPELSSEYAERLTFIELDKTVATHDKKFRTDNILNETKINHNKIYSAFHCLFSNWKDNYLKDKYLPEGVHRKKGWSSIIQGILRDAYDEVVEELKEDTEELSKYEFLNAFNLNYNAYLIKSDPVTTAMNHFCQTLEEQIRLGWVKEEWTCRDIYHIACYYDNYNHDKEDEVYGDPAKNQLPKCFAIFEDDSVIPRISQGNKNRSSKTTLVGKFIGKIAGTDKIYDTKDKRYRIRVVGKKNPKKYRLEVEIK